MVTVLLGGPNRSYSFSRADAARLVDKLQMIVDRDNAFLVGELFGELPPPEVQTRNAKKSATIVPASHSIEYLL